MDRVDSAERLLRVACGRDRAAEIIGDLLEDDRGVLKFWQSVAQLMFAWSWRWIVGVFVASASSVALMVCFAKLFLLRTGLPVDQNGIWVTASLCICSMLAINACRFGLRDRVTLVAAGFTSLLIGVACAGSFLKAQHLWFATTSVLVIGLVSNATRKSLLILLGAAISYAAVFGLLTRVLVEWPGTNAPKPFMFGLTCCWFIGISCEAWVIAETRRFIQ